MRPPRSLPAIPIASPGSGRQTVRRSCGLRALVRPRRGDARLALLLVPLLGACTDLEYQGFLDRPIPITLQADVPLVQLLLDGGSAFTATLDSSTPLSVVDQGGSARRVQGELRLQDARAPEVTRFIFRNLDLFDLPARLVGLDPGIAIRGVLGANLLRHFVVRLSYADEGTVTLKDQIADTKENLASDCDPALLLGALGARPSCLGVWSTPPVGGGLVEIGGDSLELEGSRLVMPLCLLPDLFDPSPADETGPQRTSGVPATAVLATGQGVSVMSRSLLERLRASGVDIAEQGPVTLHVPYGSETATLVTITRMAAVSDETIDLGPCAELAHRRRLLVGSRTGVVGTDRDYQGASVALIQRSVVFAVVDDPRPLIQGLRQELAPFVGDVDVLLGGSFLSHFDVDLDYPGKRVILRCAEGQTPGACEVLPFCSFDETPRCPDRTGP